MSGRRRRDDGWDDGRLDAQDDRRDPWADDGIGDWGGADADPGDDADRLGKSSGGAAGAYVRNAPPGGKAYAAPDFPSFQATGTSSSGSDQYGGGSSYGGQRADGYREAGYGGSRDGYQGSGYGSSGNGGSRRDASGYDAAYGGADSANGYSRPGNGPGGRGNDAGYGNGSAYGSGSGYAGANGRPGSVGFAPEFTPVENDEGDDDGPADTPRPYGRLSIYTLHEDKTREFDRLAERAAEGVRTSEPDTLVYVIHVVPKAPMQRIIYEIYRDRAAFVSHERQSHIRQFAADRAPCVLATNIIDLRLKYAKVAALGPPTEAPARGQAQPTTWNPRAAEAAPSSDRYSAAAQYSSTQYAPTQYASSQYSPAPTPEAAGAGTSAASFTPAKDRYGAENSQYPTTVGREAYSPAAQYGNSGNGAYGAGNSQYGAANSNGYSGAAGYANGGSYSSSGYPASNGYQGANGYASDNGYSGANGYQSANGYSGANGYSNGSGYSQSNGYSNGNYSAANGYSNGSGYSNGAANGAANGGANGYGAAGGYADGGAGSYGASNGASNAASNSAQYTPRYRELTSGAQPEVASGGYQDNGNRYTDDTRQSARPQPNEWDPRSQGYR
jgi:quinol monooxygenase YgiN